jgi:Ni,Fe-hydrogenase III small subunit
VASLKPSDVIVVECDGMVTKEMAERIRMAMRDIWPDNRTVVTDSTMHIKVIHGS